MKDPFAVFNFEGLEARYNDLLTESGRNTDTEEWKLLKTAFRNGGLVDEMRGAIRNVQQIVGEFVAATEALEGDIKFSIRHTRNNPGSSQEARESDKAAWERYREAKSKLT